MIILVVKYLIPKGYKGITFFPFIILLHKKDKQNEVLVNHEKIHIRQQFELLVFPFFVWYFIEFFIRFLKHKNWNTAYRNISFEREAYSHEKDLNYLKKRSFWSWVKYF
ncbi:hypothetical protein FIA58_006850 [Flavobacterium jejuense]|uniref:Peptidase M56 domain-containing protein n=1 Tax=Flavobacterium jejuense TaxID=1544455 RepID=A0ABX0IUB1_9FLAO|nr:hypothetical protein [Flavobacterium jejuense]NHN25389.1 hypothetical protein [Flavobacterium jejuense]